MLSFFDKYNVLTENQFGFRKNRSTCLVLSIFALNISLGQINHMSLWLKRNKRNRFLQEKKNNETV